MSYQEKKSLISIFTSLVLFVIYSIFVYNKFQGETFESLTIYQFWSRMILLLIPVSIVVNIVAQIIFHIIYYISTREEPPQFEDERDKLIELKASRISMYLFIIGFFMGIGSQSLGFSPHVMFITFGTCGLLAAISGSIAEFLYYRRGF